MCRDDGGSGSDLADAHLGVAGIIVAGGKSRRMGRDKAQLKIDGATLLARTACVLAEVANEVLVVGRETLPSGMGRARAALDDVPDSGPLGGLATGMRCAAYPLVIAVSCDLPFISADILRLLIRLAPGYDAVVPRPGGKPQPLAAVYDRSLGPRAAELVARGERRVLDFVESLTVRWVEDNELVKLDPRLRAFTNVNTEEEWQAILNS